MNRKPREPRKHEGFVIGREEKSVAIPGTKKVGRAEEYRPTEETNAAMEFKSFSHMNVLWDGEAINRIQIHFKDVDDCVNFKKHLINIIKNRKWSAETKLQGRVKNLGRFAVEIIPSKFENNSHTTLLKIVKHGMNFFIPSIKKLSK